MLKAVRNDEKECASTFYALLGIGNISEGLRPFCASSLNLMRVCAPPSPPRPSGGKLMYDVDNQQETRRIEQSSG